MHTTPGRCQAKNPKSGNASVSGAAYRRRRHSERQRGICTFLIGTMEVQIPRADKKRRPSE